MNYTAWDDCARSELRKRLRSGITASPHEIKQISKRITKQERFTLQNVKDEGVEGITQLLLTMGAECRVELTDGVTSNLFKNIPKR